MTRASSKKDIQRGLIFTSGMVLMVLGVVLILSWWSYLVVVFKGAIGVVLALVALCLFVLAKE